MQEERGYQNRARSAPSGAIIAVRAIYTAVILFLIVLAGLTYLRSTALGRAEDAYYYVAGMIAGGEQPDYDMVTEEKSVISSPEKLGLKASGLWRTEAEVRPEKGIAAKCTLCSPVLDRLNIEISSTFPMGEKY